VAWTNRGAALIELGRHQEALESYEEALRLNPDLPEAWTGRGFALRELEGYKEALDSYNEALKLEPDDPETWLNHGVALDLLERHLEALESFDKALKLKPDLPEAWNNRGLVLASLGRYQEALNSYEEALKLRPDLPEAWLNRGLALVSLERFQEAVESYIKALEYKPDFPEAFKEIIEALKRLEEWLRDRRLPPLSVQCYEEVTATEERLHMFLRQRLQKEFGKKEEDWWVKGVPLDIRKKCAQRREEASWRQHSIYNYTDLIDLKDILDRHWRLFEADFQRVKSEVKSKREFLANLVRLNEIRKTVMHPVRGDLTEGDLDFVRRMRQVVKNFAAPG
jgi:Flp pilus assembly protein TadD